MKLISQVITVFLILLGSEVYASDWKEIVSDEELRYQVDFESILINREKSIVLFWQSVEFLKKNKWNPMYKVRIEMMCTSRTYIIRSSTGYDEAGKPVDKQPHQIDTIEHIIPDTALDYTHRLLCAPFNSLEKQ